MSNIPIDKPVNGRVSYRHRFKRMLWHVFARQMMLFFVIASTLAGWLGRKKRSISQDGCEIMLTGRFDSKNWILAHLVPLANSKQCSRLWMVSTNPVPDIPKVEAIYPPKWLQKCFGVTTARLMTFFWAAMRRRPHIVGGFHIMVNGIAAIIAGRLVGARSIYFCVGGPAEVLDGGVHSSDSIVNKMETPDAVVEQRFLKLLAQCDTIVTMGSRAVRFFKDRGIKTDFYIVSGGIDVERFQPTQEKRQYDCIMTGRLVEIKRIDIFLQVIKIIKAEMPGIKALIVGDGRLKDILQQLARELDIEDNVHFAGHKDDIENWLRKSKIFVLTSDSEGLSLSMMEAMMTGLSVVVSDVGDLADLVENNVNGYLVPRRNPELFAKRLTELLSDEKKLKVFSDAARQSAQKYTMQAAIERWDQILSKYSE